MPFKIVRNDITKMQVDAIVNTANEEPIYSGGTDYAVYQAAGEELLLAERKSTPMLIPQRPLAYGLTIFFCRFSRMRMEKSDTASLSMT